MKDKKKIIIGTLLLVVILTLVSVMIQKKLVNKESSVVSYRLINSVDKGDTITDDNLEEIKLKNSNDNADYIKSKGEVTGMIVKEKMYAKEIVNKKRLVSENDNNYFTNKGNRRFSIDLTYFDDTFSISMQTGSVVDILFTQIDDNKNAITNVELENVAIVGRIDSEGKWIDETSTKLAQSIVFESSTDKIIDITSKQYKGKFKLVQLPINE